MASEIKKYVSVNDSTNVVQGEMNFPDAKLKIQDGEQYKDINDVFIKSVSLFGAEGSEPINAEVSDGNAELNIDGLDVEELSAENLIADDIQTDTIQAERLFVGEVDMNRFMSNLTSAGEIGGVETIDGSYTQGDLKDKYNALAEKFTQLLTALANVTSSGSQDEESNG